MKSKGLTALGLAGLASLSGCGVGMQAASLGINNPAAAALTGITGRAVHDYEVANYNARRVAQTTHAQSMNGSINRLDVEYNVVDNGINCLGIDSAVSVHNAQGRSFWLGAYFYDEKGQTRKDIDGQFSASTGQICVGTYLRDAPYPNTTWGDIKLRIPHGQMDLQGAGEHRVLFRLELLDVTDASNPTRVAFMPGKELRYQR